MSFWTTPIVGDLGRVMMGPGAYGYAKQHGWLGVPKDKMDLPYYQNPDRPEYARAFDPGTMSMHPYAQFLTANIMPDTRGIQAYRGEALRTAPSAWSQVARAQLSADEAAQRDALARQSAGAAATARSQLAMRGGLGGGAAERLATQASRDQMAGAQALSQQALSGRAKIGVQDEANRLRLLQGLPGMEIDQLRPAQWAAQMQYGARASDMGNIVSENERVNKWNMDAYQEAMRQLQAMRNADVMLATAPKDKGLIRNILGGLF